MNEQEKHAASQEERKEKIRARYKGVDRSELEFSSPGRITYEKRNNEYLY